MRRILLSLILVVYLYINALMADGQSIINLQTERSQTNVSISGQFQGQASLINLNPYANIWYILEVQKASGSVETYHLENVSPSTQHISIDEDGLVIAEDSTQSRCYLWSEGSDNPLIIAKKSKRPYVEICDGRLYLLNAVTGKRTRKEWATDLLRDRVRYGEQITNFIKERFYRDKYRRAGSSKLQESWEDEADELNKPGKLMTKGEADSISLTTPDLNFTITRDAGGGVKPGRWYPIPGYPGIFISSIIPKLIPDDSSWTRNGLISPLEEKELSALIYLVAFDLSMFKAGFALGTDHPRVDWSDRIPEVSRIPNIPGPDGFDNVAPLVRAGKINPRDVTDVAATFAGGFKRTHGAFKWGELANKNLGSHYGFVENGVVFSTLQPGLATFLIYADGNIEIKTWEEGEPYSFEQIFFARQNGVPLLEPGDSAGSVRPGKFVREWGKGNWSGSETKQLRTLRAGAGIQETSETRFLIYGYFTSATPSTMARVFRACGCNYAMHLDMNAPEHTYLAIYRIEKSQFIVQRLVGEMAEVDPPVSGQELPRYIGYSDNRDFFYLLRKNGDTK